MVTVPFAVINACSPIWYLASSKVFVVVFFFPGSPSSIWILTLQACNVQRLWVLPVVALQRTYLGTLCATPVAKVRSYANDIDFPVPNQQQQQQPDCAITIPFRTFWIAVFSSVEFLRPPSDCLESRRNEAGCRSVLLISFAP